MRLFFIRHGQSTNNAKWDLKGNNEGRVPDPGLTELGRKQAEVLADFLAHKQTQDPEEFGITHLYTSLFLRAVETGERVRKTLGLPLVAWPEIHEGGGVNTHDEKTGEIIGLPGESRSYFETHYPDLILPDSLGEEGWWNRPREKRVQIAIRAQSVLLELRQRHGEGNDRVAMISHGGFFNYFLMALLHKTSRDDCWFTMYNTAITRIDILEDETKFVYINRTDHIPPELIS
jgi:2,3-bisphosphoglycerate-dependent phosphoglycerate mutase